MLFKVKESQLIRQKLCKWTIFGGLIIEKKY